MLTAFKELICLLQPAYQSLKVFLTVHDRSIVEGIEYGIQPALKPQTPTQCDAYYSKGNRFPESSTSASFVDANSVPRFPPCGALGSAASYIICTILYIVQVRYVRTYVHAYRRERTTAVESNSGTRHASRQHSHYVRTVPTNGRSP